MNSNTIACLTEQIIALNKAGKYEEAVVIFNRLVAACAEGGVTSAPAVQAEAWKLINRYIVIQAAPGLSRTQYIYRLVQTFGPMVGMESAEAGVTKVAAGSSLAGRVLGWPLMLATILFTVGCNNQNIKDQDASRQAAWYLYNNQYLVRYLRWAITWRRYHPAMVLQPPQTFEVFLENQCQMAMPK